MHIKHMHEMIEDLSSYGKCMIESGTGEGDVNLCEAGQIVDMIKDLADAEYHARMAKYLEKQEDEEEEEDEYLLRMLREQYGEEDGKRYYDNYRYANGRFAPKGRGRRMGYPYPDYHMMPEYYEDRDLDLDIGRMYSPIVQGDNRYMESSKYGSSYDNYMRKRKGYSTSDPAQKHERMKLMEEESGEIISMISDMIEDASPEEKNILKNKLTKLVNAF